MASKETIFIERLRLLLKESGLSQSKLSLKAGLARGMVAGLFSDGERTPHKSTVTALANALAVDPAFLRGDIDNRTLKISFVEGVGLDLDLIDRSVKTIAVAMNEAIKNAPGILFPIFQNFPSRL